MKHQIKSRIKLNSTQLAEFAFIMFFANPFLRIAFGWLTGGNSTVATVLALLFAYVPLLWVYIIAPKKYFKFDCLIIYFVIILFFVVTLAIHPEYAYYYGRANYGVWEHVLIPYRGIYAYLFIRLFDDPNRILTCMKKSGWLMTVYFAYQISLYLRRGFWYGVLGTDASARLSYSVSFGYEVLPFALIFLYLAFKNKKISDIIFAAISVVMIVIGGSRGPFLFLGLFIVLYLLFELQRSKKKTFIILGIIVLIGVLYFAYEPILKGLSSLVTRMGFSSRFIDAILNGSISNDSGRARIWETTVNMIRENPFGYGAMGSRHFLSQIIAAGYPHSVLLEILVDFGVIFGSAIIIFLFVNSALILRSERKREWRGVFLVFFCAACSLFISLTFWSTYPFWCCIAIGVNCHLATRKSYRLKPSRLRLAR